MIGRFIAVVGPSGVRKDCVKRAMTTAEFGIVLARRVIMWPSDAGGEGFDSVCEARFVDMVSVGAFALHWSAHGLQYGIPAALDADLAVGQDVLTNLSRRSLAAAKARYNQLIEVSMSALQTVLATRFAARGRDDATEVQCRLAQVDFEVAQAFAPLIIDNGGPLKATVDAA